MSTNPVINVKNHICSFPIFNKNLSNDEIQILNNFFSRPNNEGNILETDNVMILKNGNQILVFVTLSLSNMAKREQSVKTLYDNISDLNKIIDIQKFNIKVGNRKYIIDEFILNLRSGYNLISFPKSVFDSVQI